MPESMSLRERKKLASRRAIRDAALRLYGEQGYEATTVEQIAAAAEVSRATFFNYFAGKEAVVLDPDPEEWSAWAALLEGRPAEEPLWDSLTVILEGFCESLRERMPLMRRLKAQSPDFARTAASFGEQFFTQLGEWVAARLPEADRTAVTLQLKLALAATDTAYQTWPAEASFDEFLQRLDRCLREARPAVASG